MSYIDPPHNHLAPTNWQTLGELRLRSGSSLNGTINQWVTKTLGPFSLPGDFVNNVLRSIEEAAARVLGTDIERAQFEYLDLIILAPAGLTFKGQTWGFFRVERTFPGTQIEKAKGHCINYYIYLDRKPGEYEQTP